MEKKQDLEFYMSLEDAKIEIQKRWADKDLRKKVEDFLVEMFYNLIIQHFAGNVFR